LINTIKQFIDSVRLIKLTRHVREECLIYNDLALLIEKTTRIESLLTYLHGEGKGIYEKAESVVDDLPHGFLEKIIEVAEIRNRAVHGNGHVKSLNIHIEKCDRIIIILKQLLKIMNLRVAVKLKLKEFHCNSNIEASFDPKLSAWLIKLHQRCDICGTDQIDAFLDTSIQMFNQLNGYSCKYYAKRWLKHLLRATLVILTLFILAVFIMQSLPS